MNILIDADYIVYKCCAACETEIDYGEDVIFVTSNFSDAYKAVTNEIQKITANFGGFSEPILFFSDTKNFRKKFLQNTKVIEIERSLADTNELYLTYVFNTT